MNDSSKWGYFCLFLLAFVLLAVIASCPTTAHAKPLAGISQQGVSILFTDEPCTLAAVKNLPNRVTWEEKGVLTEGCYSITGGIVVAYFADLTVTLIPAQAIKPVSDI